MDFKQEVELWQQRYSKLFEEIKNTFSQHLSGSHLPEKTPPAILDQVYRWEGTDNLLASWFNPLFNTKINPARILRDASYREYLREEFTTGAPLNLVLMIIARNKIFDEEMLTTRTFNSLFRKYQQRVEIFFKGLPQPTRTPIYSVDLPLGGKLLNYAQTDVHQTALGRGGGILWSMYGTPDNSRVDKLAKLLYHVYDMLEQYQFGFLFRNRVFRVVMHDRDQDPIHYLASYAQPVALTAKDHAPPASQKYSIEVLEAVPLLMKATRISGLQLRTSDIMRTIIHELGHAYYWEILTESQRKIYESTFQQAVDSPSYPTFSTEYSRNAAWENFAETFSILVTGDRQLTADDYQRFVDVMAARPETKKQIPWKRT